jgi:hypothetical protein
MPHPNTFLRFPGGRDKALSFTFDDGCVEDRRLIEKIGELGLRATCNINSDWFDLVLPYSHRMTAEETVSALDREYVEIASHGAKHADCMRMDGESFLWDAIKDRAQLEALFHRPITGYAFPQGAVTEEAKRDIERAGFEYARGVGFPGHFELPRDLYCIQGTIDLLSPSTDELIDRFLSTKCDTWIWGDTGAKLCEMFVHSYCIDSEEKWELCFSRLEKLAHHDDVWYATNIEVVRYIKAYRSLIFSLEHEYVYNPSALDLWIYVEDKTVEVKSGATVAL